MSKRKSVSAGEVVAEPMRRSLRLRKTEDSTTTAAEKRATNGDGVKHPAKKRASRPNRQVEEDQSEPVSEPPAKKSRSSKRQPETSSAGKKSGDPKTQGGDATAPSSSVTTSKDGEERNYWLMKAEPESRFENGVDVKFSIDDLAAKAEPEPWDGIRAYAARNNLRAMKKGDLAFFYHSNCKEPGIVGTMEIVQEHSPDLSAHDPKAPYYDPNSKPSDPKWSVVHVKFRSKFAVPIGLKELREMGAAGKPLENMQMLKQSRLSVSKVNAAEWEYLMGVAEEKASKA
ncbi:PUA-like domain-containing protein [Madurella fahalii]|uniref:PUA-like domain-containing protein n=1 Tax=Madurella fahalii TaxID=1157608 RepID=A0ABQ0GK62_9PEZI